jgi:hypothetical protein
MQKNFKQIWPGRTTPPKFLGKNALATKQQTDFHKFGRALALRAAQTFPEGKTLPIEFNILDLDFEGAWVVWTARCYGVFMTTALLWKIQRVCWHAAEYMRKGKTILVKMNFLRELWDVLPEDDVHFHHFGGLLAHIAFSFIVHHELAHAGLGHQGIVRPSCVIPDDTYGEWGHIAELPIAPASYSPKDNYVRSQSLETDADVHALFYTRRLIADEAKMLDQAHMSDVGRAVFTTLLRDTRSQQLMVFIGVAIGLLLLRPDLESGKFKADNIKTHPPLPSRLLLMFHVAGSITKYDANFYENRSAAISAAITLIGIFLKEENGLGIWRNAQDLEPSKFGSTEGESGSKWDSLSHISIVDAMQRLDEIGPYWEKLVFELRAMIPTLNHYARFPEFMCYSWYREARVV